MTETGPINQSTPGINWSSRRSHDSLNQDRQQQQVVENQVSNWPTRYVVLGGFTPGTPVSTPFFLKRKEKN